ncbi:MAG: hypothetical protein HRU70_06275 [Phycisphaeraceae bacterium]|nr:MAG: hypothetical protein HRU70_06275 [Phycisphaeraceae bacterium]
MTGVTQTLTDHFVGLLRRRAEEAGVFGAVEVAGGRVSCRAKASAALAHYRVECAEGRVWVSLVTKDRWLSQSIEADLVHTGDRLEDLLDEELVEQGEFAKARPARAEPGRELTVQHFRSESREFTFRTPVPAEPWGGLSTEHAERTARYLLAYEACFRRLGDMEAGEGDD